MEDLIFTILLVVSGVGFAAHRLKARETEKGSYIWYGTLIVLGFIYFAWRTGLLARLLEAIPTAP
jgi:heme/copper-type cytochrome/quinol oxidase subunit 3